MLYQRDALNYTTHQAVHIKTNKYERNEISTEKETNKFNQTVYRFFVYEANTVHTHTHAYIYRENVRIENILVWRSR